MGLFGGDSAALEVEESFGIELAYGGAMGASDIIGIDFELRLGTDSSCGREEQIPIGLVGIGFLCAGTDENAAAEQAVSVAEQNAVKEFLAAASRGGMVHMHLMVGDSVMVDQIETVKEAFRLWFPQRWGELHAGEVGAEGNGMARKSGLALKLDRKSTYVDGRMVFVLEVENFQVCFGLPARCWTRRLDPREREIP